MSKRCDTLILAATVIDGSGKDPYHADVAITGDRISALGELDTYPAREVIDAAGSVLAPGFIDVHTHDDTSVIRTPEMLSKLSQGITTVIVGNCGISAAPVRLRGTVPDPMNLLGDADAFCYPTFSSFVAAVNAAKPSVNVAALVGHTALRNNHMDALDRAANSAEIQAMREQLLESLAHGALGLSTGLAYLSAYSASSEEVLRLAELLPQVGGIYTTHMRSEAAAVLQAMQEAFDIGQHCKVPIIISHLKCAGVDNWGRSGQLLKLLDSASRDQEIGCDCYPYHASSSTLDLRQVDERVEISITWSTAHPDMAGQTLRQIAEAWGISPIDAAQRLQPAGAIYHNMSEDDMRAILRHPKTMIGSDGLPNDPRPHPRLWGTFPRVLGYYTREQKLFALPEAVRKMTGLAAMRFGLADRGFVREGGKADLVLFNPESVRDRATFADPIRPAEGIAAVWVNGILSYWQGSASGARAGQFLPRDPQPRTECSVAVSQE